MLNTEVLRLSYPYKANVFTVFDNQKARYKLDDINPGHLFSPEESEYIAMVCHDVVFAALGFLGNDFPDRRVNTTAQVTYEGLIGGYIVPHLIDDLVRLGQLMKYSGKEIDKLAIIQNEAHPMVWKNTQSKRSFSPSPDMRCAKSTVNIYKENGIFLFIPFNFLSLVNNNPYMALLNIASVCSMATDLIMGREYVDEDKTPVRAQASRFAVYQEARKINPELEIIQAPKIDSPEEVFYPIPNIAIPAFTPIMFRNPEPANYPQ